MKKSNRARKAGGATGQKERAVELLHEGRPAEAVRAFQKLRDQCPSDAEVHYLLGLAQGRAGQFADALESFRRAVALQPAVAAAQCGLGATLRALGRPEEAIAPLREASRLMPQMAEAHVELAETLRSLGRLDEAKSSYQEALRHNPRLGLAHFSLGKIHHSQGQLRDAATHYREAIELNPGAVEAMTNLGKVLIYLGKRREAAATFDKALQLKPDCPDARGGRAVVHELQGNYEQAYDLVASLAEKGIPDEMAAVTFLDLCQRFGRCREALAYAEQTLAEPAVLSHNGRHVFFALAKRLDALGEYDEAFERATQANKLYDADYDPAAFTAHVDDLMKYFDLSFMARAPRCDPSSKRPIFIVGMPRSGTSLVEQILATHPKVFGAGELEKLNQTTNVLPTVTGSRAGYPACVGELSLEAVKSLARDYLKYIGELAPPETRVTDKMPHNFLHLGLIGLMFPDAPIIHCVRNPLDTCLSIYMQRFDASHGYARSLDHIGAHYLDYQRLMLHWKTALQNPVLDVRYEELVSRPEPVVARMLEFCGLAWDDRCLSFHANERAVDTLSYDQVRQPLYSRSVGRWKRYQRYLGPLRSMFGDQVA